MTAITAGVGGGFGGSDVLRRIGPAAECSEGRLVLHPCRPSPFGEMTLHGKTFAGQSCTVHCAADGTTTVLDAPPDPTIELR